VEAFHVVGSLLSLQDIAFVVLAVVTVLPTRLWDQRPLGMRYLLHRAQQRLSPRHRLNGMHTGFNICTC
jgi:hypothetical protein